MAREPMLDQTSRSSAALRARRLRQRRRLGLRVFAIELDEFRTIDALIDRGVITEDEGLDPGAVSRALEKIIADLTAHRHA
jgi:hypothetical protein